MQQQKFQDEQIIQMYRENQKQSLNSIKQMEQTNQAIRNRVNQSKQIQFERQSSTLDYKFKNNLTKEVNYNRNENTQKKQMEMEKYKQKLDNLLGQYMGNRDRNGKKVKSYTYSNQQQIMFNLNQYQSPTKLENYGNKESGQLPSIYQSLNGGNVKNQNQNQDQILNLNEANCNNNNQNLNIQFEKRKQSYYKNPKYMKQQQGIYDNDFDFNSPNQQNQLKNAYAKQEGKNLDDILNSSAIKIQKVQDQNEDVKKSYNFVGKGLIVQSQNLNQKQNLMNLDINMSQKQVQQSEQLYNDKNLDNQQRNQTENSNKKVNFNQKQGNKLNNDFKMQRKSSQQNDNQSLNYENYVLFQNNQNKIEAQVQNQNFNQFHQLNNFKKNNNNVSNNNISNNKGASSTLRKNKVKQDNQNLNQEDDQFKDWNFLQLQGLSQKQQVQNQKNRYGVRNNNFGKNHNTIKDKNINNLSQKNYKSLDANKLEDLLQNNKYEDQDQNNNIGVYTGINNTNDNNNNLNYDLNTDRKNRIQDQYKQQIQYLLQKQELINEQQIKSEQNSLHLKGHKKVSSYQPIQINQNLNQLQKPLLEGKYSNQEQRSKIKLQQQQSLKSQLYNQIYNKQQQLNQDMDDQNLNQSKQKRSISAGYSLLNITSLGAVQSKNKSQKFQSLNSNNQIQNLQNQNQQNQRKAFKIENLNRQIKNQQKQQEPGEIELSYRKIIGKNQIQDQVQNQIINQNQNMENENYQYQEQSQNFQQKNYDDCLQNIDNDNKYYFSESRSKRGNSLQKKFKQNSEIIENKLSQSMLQDLQQENDDQIEKQEKLFIKKHFSSSKNQRQLKQSVNKGSVSLIIDNESQDIQKEKKETILINQQKQQNQINQNQNYNQNQKQIQQKSVKNGNLQKKNVINNTNQFAAQLQQLFEGQQVNQKMFTAFEYYKLNSKEKQDSIYTKIFAFKDFLNLLNFSNRISVNFKPSQNNFKAYVASGNNGTLIKSILQRNRWWWQVVSDDKDESVNFVWTQSRKKDFLGIMKSYSQVLEDRQFENINQDKIKGKEKKNGLDEGKEGRATEKFLQKNSEISDNQDELEQNGDYKNKGENLIFEGNLEGNLQRKNDQVYFQKLKQIMNISDAYVMAVNRKDQSINQKQNQMTLKYGFIFDIESEYQHNLFQVIQSQKLKQKNDENLMKENQGEIENENEDGIQLQQKQESQVYLKNLNLDMSQMKVHNHLSNNYHLSNKKALFYNLKYYYQAINTNPFDHIPLTFHIKQGASDIEFQNFSQKFQELQQKSSKKKNQNIWIIKPGESTNRGYGIQVSDNLETIKNMVDDKKYKDRTYIVQKYLERPLLYNKRKFDIRCYMLVTCYNGITKAYWYQEGYIRTSSKEYSLKNLENKAVHLTNDCVQKKYDDYGKFENGNKLSFQDFQRYLDSLGNSVDFMEKIYPQMKKLAKDSVASVYSKIHKGQQAFCFELFGLDFMIDEAMKVWLIEVNCNPDITTGTPILSRIIPQMLDNLFRIALDPIFYPPNWPKSKKAQIPENLYQQNKFEIIFDQQYDVEVIQKQFKNFESMLKQNKMDVTEAEQNIEEENDIILDEEDEQQLEEQNKQQGKKNKKQDNENQDIIKKKTKKQKKLQDKELQQDQK